MFVKGSNIQLAERNESPGQLLFLDGTFCVTLIIHKDEQVDRYSFQLHSLLIIYEILLEIGCIEEMSTTWGNKEVPKLFSQFPLFAKIVLIRLTSYHWQLCTS